MMLNFSLAVCVAAAVMFGCRQTTAPIAAQEDFWANASQVADVRLITNTMDWDFSRITEFQPYVIMDSVGYQNFLDSLYTGWNSPLGDSEKVAQPIDFSTRSVLAMYIQHSVDTLTHLLYINDTIKQYLYRVHIEQKTMQFPLFHSFNLVTVPRLKEGYDVKGDTTYKSLW